MKILVTPTSFLQPQNEDARAKLEAFADKVVYNDLGVPLKGDEILKRLDGVDGYIAGADYISADVVFSMPESVKVISRYGVGVDRVDLDACKKRGIIVTNTPGANATAVCELTLGLMICAARNITMLHAAVSRGKWPRNNGIELAGKTLGIVGLGAIGKKLAVRAITAEMNVMAYDIDFDGSFALKHGIYQANLDELLKESDVISLHIPLTEKTRHLINATRIDAMKKGAIIINTARGGLIDEVAAAEALRDGKLGGLGLDAFEQEPLMDSPLKGLPNVVFTPHTGAHTREATAKMACMAVDNATAVLKGEPCSYIIR